MHLKGVKPSSALTMTCSICAMLTTAQDALELLTRGVHPVGYLDVVGGRYKCEISRAATLAAGNTMEAKRDPGQTVSL